MTSPLPLGIHKDLTYAEYDADPGVRATALKTFERSDLHAFHARTHQKDSASLILGNAVHIYALERDDYAELYQVAPKVDKRTKVGKAQWAEFEAESVGKILITDEDHFKIKGMGESLLAHPQARAILAESPGVNEVTAYWEAQPAPDLPMRRCKARIDRLCSWNGIPTVADLKSTKDASPEGFEREIRKWGYHVQGPWYLGGLQALAPAARQMVYIAVENFAPFAVGVYTMDDEYIALGSKIAQSRFERLVRAEESGVWEGYKSGTLYPPEWLVKQHMEMEEGAF